jgi:hypothetical protein
VQLPAPIRSSASHIKGCSLDCLTCFEFPNPYKRQFGTDFGYDAAVLICRKTLPNRAGIALHAGLRSSIRRAKDLLRKPRDREWWEAALTVHTVEEPK